MLLVYPFPDVAPFRGDSAWRDNDAQEDSYGWVFEKGQIHKNPRRFATGREHFNGISKLKQKGWGRLICLQNEGVELQRRDWETGRKDSLVKTVPILCDKPSVPDSL